MGVLFEMCVDAVTDVGVVFDREGGANDGGDGESGGAGAVFEIDVVRGEIGKKHVCFGTAHWEGVVVDLM